MQPHKLGTHVNLSNTREQEPRTDKEFNMGWVGVRTGMILISKACGEAGPWKFEGKYCKWKKYLYLRYIGN